MFTKVRYEAGLFLKEDHRPLLLPPLGHWESQNLSPRDVAFSPENWKKTPSKQDLVSFSNARAWEYRYPEDVAWRGGFGIIREERGLQRSRFYPSFATHTPQNNLQRKKTLTARASGGAPPQHRVNPPVIPVKAVCLKDLSFSCSRGGQKEVSESPPFPR